MALVAQGAALRGAGRQDEAVQRLQQAVERHPPSGHPVTGALALGVLGYCWSDLR